MVDPLIRDIVVTKMDQPAGTEKLAAFKTPTVVTGLYEVAAVGKPIEQRSGHLGAAEHAGPLSEGKKVGGEDDGCALVKPADEVEQKLVAGLNER
ncbi:hypothetical protein GGQ85_004078 [Nitrobacter vulgaris]|nr:hypothetical protein [Nitrobacter vulgaris]